jgi:YesN/AraC family two-component response regulator
MFLIVCGFASFDLVEKQGKEPGPVRQADRKQLRVLIADDTAAIRDSMSNLISRLRDVEIVGQAQTGTQALELIRTLKPHIATLDIRMPELSGINVLTELKREGSDTSIIMLSGLAEAEYRRKCLALGAKYFFHKATEFEQVVEVLKESARALNGEA